MKLSLGVVFFVAALSTGCMTRQLNYSHTKEYDYLSTESRGNTLDDYNFLRVKAEEMCRSENHNHGVEILDARPGESKHSGDNSFGSYVMTYRCKDASFTEKVSEVYHKVETAIK